MKHFFSKKISRPKKLHKKNILYNFDYIKCNHNFIDDYIDIDCERSQNIRYCSICYYSDIT